MNARGTGRRSEGRPRRAILTLSTGQGKTAVPSRSTPKRHHDAWPFTRRRSGKGGRAAYRFVGPSVITYPFSPTRFTGRVIERCTISDGGAAISIAFLRFAWPFLVCFVFVFAASLYRVFASQGEKAWILLCFYCSNIAPCRYYGYAARVERWLSTTCT